MFDNLCVLTGDCHNNRNNKHHLTFGDVTRMNCIIEHDRMLYNGCDRQHLLFSDDQVDEFEFVQSCKNVGWSVFPAVNNRRHSHRYFVNTDRPEPLTSQRLSQLTVS